MLRNRNTRADLDMFNLHKKGWKRQECLKEEV